MPRHLLHRLWLHMCVRPIRGLVTRGSPVIGIRSDRIIIGMRVTGRDGRMWGRTGWLRGITDTGGTADIGGGRAACAAAAGSRLPHSKEHLLS